MDKQIFSDKIFILTKFLTANNTFERSEVFQQIHMLFEEEKKSFIIALIKQG